MTNLMSVQKNSPEPADERMPDLDSQPLWIKVAAMSVAIGGLIALAVLYVVRL